jgi:aminocarboxymuconate-semialdehyde decarboxylase
MNERETAGDRPEWWPELAPEVRPTTAAKPEFRTVDVHTHLSVPAAAGIAQPFYRPEYEPRNLYSSPESLAYNREYRASERQTGQFEQAEVRLADMDRQGIDHQVLSVPPSEYFYWLDAEHARKVSRVQHERFAEVVAAHPDRFTAVANVPLDHPELAVEVLREAAGDFGFPGFEISADVVGKDLDDPRYDVVWEAAVELGMTAIMHPQGFTHGQRMTDYYLVNVLCMPLASTLAVTRMILGGVWRRHPELTMVVVHGGGYLPFYSARTDHAFTVRPELRAHIDRLPSDYLRSLYFDTNVFDPAMVRQLVDRFGAEHVLLGTDYPFDMGTTDPLAFLEDAGLDEGQRRLVLGGNAARLFRLDRRTARPAPGSPGRGSAAG